MVPPRKDTNAASRVFLLANRLNCCRAAAYWKERQGRPRRGCVPAAASSRGAPGAGTERSLSTMCAALMVDSSNRGDTVDLDVKTAGPCGDVHEDPCRRILGEKAFVDFVDGVELDRRAVDIALEHVLQR